LLTGTILIAEDQSITALDLKLILRRCGYSHIEVVSKGEKALELIQNNPPSVVLLDIKLADGISGIDVAVKLKQKNIPFIFISAFSNPNNFRLAKNLEPAGIIKKPFEEESLKYILDAL
jgi:CheY-like chemotaxis protein